jgi:subtilisin-like proprotein convertase family protein
MNKVILLLVFLISGVKIHAQNTPIWTPLDQDKTGLTQKISSNTDSKTGLFYLLNENVLREKLATIQDKKATQNTLEIEFPNSKGVLEKFLVQENSNFEPELQAKYPEIRAYSGVGINDKNATVNFSMSPDGIQTMVLRADSESEFIEKQEPNKTAYLLFDSKSRKSKTLPLVCKTKNSSLDQKTTNKTTSRIKSNTQVFKTLRLALSCTGEYAKFHGGTKAGALAAMNATMTRVNGVYNRDLSVKLIIIANNDLIVYTDAKTDPYSDANIGVNGAWHQEIQDALTNIITNSGYDIGHLFGATGGGGDAGCIGCVCADTTPTDSFEKKGAGFTSPSDGIPKGDSFDISFVAHEMGHQLGATHTFSLNLEDRNVNVEPGNGSTIMAYAGLDSYFPQAESDDYFNYVNILQIQDKLATKTCPVSTAIGNISPTVNAGPDYTIPKGTPFVLTGSGSSTNGTVSYCWEENDSATTQNGANSVAFSTKPDGPLFRSFKPSSLPIRYMPELNYVLSGNLSPAWESVADVARTLHFNLTIRDNATLGQTNTDSMIVNVSGNSGPFAITSQNKTDFYWDQGANETITWDVANTNALPGSANVNIKLSTDGGATFPTLLLANTPNDGVATIVVPALSEKNCRILIEPTGNIYYAVNSMPFAIGYKITTACKTYDFVTPFAIPESGSYTSKTINVPSSSEIITKVTLNASVTHTSLSDVQLEIVGPQNTTVKLLERNCINHKGTLSLQFDDLGKALSCDIANNETVIAINPLSIYNKTNPQGTWTLRVRDAYTNDTGTLDVASITICTQKFESTTPSTEPNKFMAYPNPILRNEDFTVEFYTNSTKGATVTVYDLLGTKKYERHFDNKGNHRETIGLKNVLHGVYLLSVSDENEKQVTKIGIN